MGIFDHLKKLSSRPEVSEEEAQALKTEIENKIRNATKQQLREFEERVYLRFQEIESLTENKMHKIKVILTKEPGTTWDKLAPMEAEIDGYLTKVSYELENETEKMISDTIKRLKLDPELIKKRFERIKTVIKATAGMGMRKNREFFDAVKLITEKDENR